MFPVFYFKTVDRYVLKIITLQYQNQSLMKKLYLLFTFAFVVSFTYAQAPFIMTFEAQGETAYERTVTIVSMYPSNFNIDFGDGTILSNQTGTVSHVYSTSGTYTISMSGSFSSIAFSVNQTNQRLRTIEQWGDTQWTNMDYMFVGCTGLTINATDAPDLSQLTSLTNMFNGCTSFNSSINNWDVSTITNMSGMFYEATAFNQPLDNWDVSNVTSMANMFYGAASFNQPLNSWDVSNVTNIGSMFQGASAFNQPINAWNVSAVNNIQSLFYMATSFNQPLSDWDVSNIENFYTTFFGAASFNQPLEDWDMSNATSLSSMFAGATSFNQPLNNWDVANVTDMGTMFQDAASFDQQLDSWNVSNVTFFANMFQGAVAFNHPIDNWDMSGAEFLSGMFQDATSFNQPLNSWDVSAVTIMYSTFSGATSFNQPLDNWDVSNVDNMTGMFYNTTSFDQDLSVWEFNPQINFGDNFSYAPFAFLGGSGLSPNNYDALLLKLSQSDIMSKNIVVTGLEYCDAALHEYMVNELGWNFYGDSLSNNCTTNNLLGNVRFDENANGCDSTDIKISNLMVTANNGTYAYSTFPSSEGEYSINLFEDTYTVGLQNLPSYFIATPTTQSVSFTGLGNTQPLDFCLTANQAVQDLNITIVPITEARPGFDAQYQLVVQNIGTQTVNNVTATLGYEILKQSFVSASQTPALINPDPPYVSFDIVSIQPFETKRVDVVLHTNAPPLVNGGDLLEIGGAVTNTNDFTPEDNAFTLNQTVVNAFDPNDKTVLQGDIITVSQLGNYLDYVVRFQNTGTASAITVRIDDVLDANLDWATLRPVNASHNYRIEITEDNHVSFIFENINLPAESTDEPGSHGFIAFKIKPLQTLQEGDIINGSAAIYFDYNEPIVTNTVTTLIQEAVAATIEGKKQDGISIYPNPSDRLVHIKHSESIYVQKISIINLQGRILMSKVGNDVIDVSGLSPGMYMVSVNTDKGTVTQKLIRK